MCLVGHMWDSHVCGLLQNLSANLMQGLKFDSKIKPVLAN